MKTPLERKQCKHRILRTRLYPKETTALPWSRPSSTDSTRQKSPESQEQSGDCTEAGVRRWRKRTKNEQEQKFEKSSHRCIKRCEKQKCEVECKMTYTIGKVRKSSLTQESSIIIPNKNFKSATRKNWTCKASLRVPSTNHSSTKAASQAYCVS